MNSNVSDLNEANLTTLNQERKIPILKTNSGNILEKKLVFRVFRTINRIRVSHCRCDVQKSDVRLACSIRGLQSYNGALLEYRMPICGRGGLLVRSRLCGRRVPGSKPDSTEDPLCIGPAAHEIIRRGTNVRPPVGAARKFEEGLRAPVSPSSSDRGSKLRGQSQSGPRVASKRDVNVTKLKPEKRDVNETKLK
ncbi:hypothetical protein AVEN_239491-1 [Araneus ventricosus]|uniref:Uncharacterized protein n=1 Tax=Araneus ventricosus TaxID=182803 RepID=A0A4Y2UXS4_ARAVE|nr:hypothetical protein AVEN_204913-1 [Araneus ventricosus]GBO14620.1 hypothetical protein AVEN_181742-1 [Araneus ventricosus]GBO16420.1 hypothetical protein AVEN_150804-1 [Araneus ventricosus]GBO16519.1 hypothetical protein AVEN_239491-1 [Araneus ventricosus]